LILERKVEHTHSLYLTDPFCGKGIAEECCREPHPENWLSSTDKNSNQTQVVRLITNVLYYSVYGKLHVCPHNAVFCGIHNKLGKYIIN